MIYVQRRKARHSTEAMIEGFPAREASSEAARMDGAAQMHILGGLQFGCLPILQQIRGARVPYIFWDRAYLGGGTATDRLRITRNGYQQSWIEPERPQWLKRFEALGGRIAEWRKPGAGEHVLVVPPGEAIRELFGLGDWLSGTLARLRKLTDRELDVSEKGDRRSLDSRLKACHCVVTWTSNVAIEAILAGVPAIVAPYSAAAPVAGILNDLAARIDAPPMPDRWAWASSLAWGQFTLAEIRSGFARSVVMGEA